MTFVRTLISTLVVFAALSSLHAQEYSTRAIQLVIPAGAGGGMDVMGRMFARFLQQDMAQDVIVVNKPGALGLIGAKYVALAPPNGYTLLFATPNSNFPVFMKNPGVDISKDLEFISMILRAPQIVTVASSSPVKTVADLIARSKTRPNNFFYASYGHAIWLMTEVFNRAAGISAKNIEYDGGGAAAALAIERGEADYFLSSIGTIRSALEAGHMRMLAVTSHERNPNLPDVPSLPEVGVNTTDLQIWMGLFAPKGTPRPIIDKLDKVVVDFTKDPAAAAFMRSLGFEPYSTTPEQFRDFFEQEEEAYVQVGKDLGIQPE